jgi:predicted Zn-dependent peptidase
VRERYSPDQLILSAAGAVDPAALLAAAERLFGGLARRPRPPVLPARFAGHEHREVRPLEQAHVALGFEGPGLREEAAYAAQIYANVLGGGMSSRLFQELREKRGLCYTIFTQAGSYDDTGLITLYAGTSADRSSELIERTIDELRRAAEGLSDPEISRARAQMKAGLLMGLESPSARAERSARMISIWDRVPDLDEVVAKVDAVTPAQIRSFAEALAVRADPAVALLGPVEGAPERAAIARRLAA